MSKKHDRECNYCKKFWPEAKLEDFVKQPDCKYGRRNFCKECWNDRNRNSWRKDNQKLRRWLVNGLSNGPCIDCGMWPKHSCQMDFDHIKDNKSASISNMVHNRRSLDAIAIEVSKCEIICANCHRLRTYMPQ